MPQISGDTLGRKPPLLGVADSTHAAPSLTSPPFVGSRGKNVLTVLISHSIVTSHGPTVSSLSSLKLNSFPNCLFKLSYF